MGSFSKYLLKTCYGPKLLQTMKLQQEEIPITCFHRTYILARKRNDKQTKKDVISRQRKFLWRKKGPVKAKKDGYDMIKEVYFDSLTISYKTKHDLNCMIYQLHSLVLFKWVKTLHKDVYRSFIHNHQNLDAIATSFHRPMDK